jgi:sucrose-phosphate synthase
MKNADRMIICDIDDTIIAPKLDNPGLDEFRQLLSDRGKQFVYGVASGRSLALIREVISEFGLPVPDVVISSVGTFISYGLEEKRTGIDKGWHGHIDHQWKPDAIRERLNNHPGVKPQETDKQNEYKISYYILDPQLSIERVKEALGRTAAGANIIMTQSAYLDILPRRASKGRAIRYVANKWSIPLQQTVVCGDAGNDLDMFNGQSRGIVVANHSPELEMLRGKRRVYFAEAPAAAGILEGLRHNQFIKAD